MPVDCRCVRVSFAVGEFSDSERKGVVANPDFADWRYLEHEDYVEYISDELRISVLKSNMALHYYDGEGKSLLSENADSPRTFEKFDSYVIDESDGISIKKIETADGEKQVAERAKERYEGSYYHIRMNLKFSEGEALYGLGQHEEGNLFYNAIKSAIALRYNLMPYIYSQVYRVWRDDDSMISMLAGNIHIVL